MKTGRLARPLRTAILLVGVAAAIGLRAASRSAEAEQRLREAAGVATRDLPAWRAPAEPSVPSASRVAEAEIAAPAALPAWLFHRRPLLVTRRLAIEIPDPEHWPPIVTARVMEGGIEVVREESPSNQLVMVTDVSVDRSEAGPDGPWETRAIQDGAVHTWLDRTARPGRAYWYRLRERAEPGRAPWARGPALPAEQREQAVVVGPIRR